MLETDFQRVVERHRRELTVHCYRMLGSFADAEDMLQETLLKAWQGIAGFEGRSSLRTWLYRIATNVCLDAIARRERRSLPSTSLEPGDPRAALPAPVTEPVWIEPLPDRLLAGGDPEARYSERESVALAFVAALQTLPARQRAILLLRDVLGFSAAETAELLEVTTAAVNSALQRARQSVQTRTAVPDRPSDEHRRLLERFIRAWESGDPAAVVALLRDDAVFSMPPLPLWFSGAADIGAFLSGLFARGATFRGVMAGASGQPAVAIYRRRDDASFELGALYVLTVAGGAIAELHAFLELADPERFDVAAVLDA